MNLYGAIQKRKSIRSYIQEPLSEAEIEGLVDFISAQNPPEEEIDWNFDTLPTLDMVKICAREPWLKAPHYLVLRAERKFFSLQLCGYLGELACLYLTEQGIGSCWLGNIAVDPAQDFSGSLPFVGAIAFGRTEESFGDGFFDRLPAAKTCFGRYTEYRDIMDAARFAPSALNRQPCVFVADEREQIHVYRRKVFMNNPVVSYNNSLDAGCAMAHLEVAAHACGRPRAKLLRLKREPAFKHMIYQGTLRLEPQE